MFDTIEFPLLKVLIVDPDDVSAEKLVQSLISMTKVVQSVYRVSSLKEANKILSGPDINSIYIDPLLLNLDKSSEFIFEVRRTKAYIVFVLYLDFAKMEAARTEFFRGERSRFSKYYKLNKQHTPIQSFQDEVSVTTRKCQDYLFSSQTNKLQDRLTSYQTATTSDTANIPLSMLQDIQNQLQSLKVQLRNEPMGVKPKTVFLSYRFAETEYIGGLTALLKRDGFEIKTGQNANTYISQAILERIRSCEFFICLMTRAEEKKDGTFTTSSWLLEEKGAALAMGKRVVLLVEDGVNEIGGLEGDWQRIYFTAKSFTSAALTAVDQLKSYSGL